MNAFLEANPMVVVAFATVVPAALLWAVIGWLAGREDRAKQARDS